MFLLNKASPKNPKTGLKFTIQNVSIKLNIKCRQLVIFQNLQYKMFLLNFESEVPVSDEDINLQYKMFLLNLNNLENKNR